MKTHSLEESLNRLPAAILPLLRCGGCGIDHGIRNGLLAGGGSGAGVCLLANLFRFDSLWLLIGSTTGGLVVGAVLGALLGIPAGFIAGLIGAALGRGRRGWALAGGLAGLLVGETAFEFLKLPLWYPLLPDFIFLTLGTLLAAPAAGAIAGWRLARALEGKHHAGTGPLRRALAAPEISRLPCVGRISLAALLTLTLLDLLIHALRPLL